MSWLHLAIVVYFSIGGGPFGFEESLMVSNPAWSLWSLLVVALLWALPQSLTMAELSVRYEGGYNEWVYRAFGFHLGLFHSLIRTLFNVICNACYLALFYDYINALYHEYLFFEFTDFSLVYFLVKVPTIVIFACVNVAVNVLGARYLSSVGVVLTVAVILPFVVLLALSVPSLDLSQLVAFNVALPDASFPKMVSVVMFNLMGWDFVGNVSSQAKKPQRDVPVAMIVSLALVLLTYTIPTVDLVTTLDFTLPPSDPHSADAITEPLYIACAKRVWEPLAYIIEVATLVGVFGLASMFLQTSSQALAHATQFTFLPLVFARAYPGTNTPYFALIFQSLFAVTVATFVTFNQIVSVQMWYLSVSTVLIMLSYLVVRWRSYLRRESAKALFYLPFHPVLLTAFVLPTILLSFFQLFYKVGEWYVIGIGVATLVACAVVVLAFVLIRKHSACYTRLESSSTKPPDELDSSFFSHHPADPPEVLP